MSCLALEYPAGRRLSAPPFAALKGAQEYLQWRYPEASVRPSIGPDGRVRFTVADFTVAATDYAHFAALKEKIASMNLPSLHAAPHEALLRAFFEQEFEALHAGDAERAVAACAELAARLVLRGREQAVGIAQVSLGQWPSDHAPDAWAWQ